MMTPQIRSYLFLAALVVTASGPALAQDVAVVKELSRLEDEWGVADARHDGAAIGRMLSNDYMGTGARGQFVTKAQLMDSVSQSKDTIVSETGSDYRVRVYGGTAVIHGIVTVVVKKGTATQTSRYRWTDTWVKQPNASWLCVASQGTELPK
jgi:hypothetical protein